MLNIVDMVCVFYWYIVIFLINFFQFKVYFKLIKKNYDELKKIYLVINNLLYFVKLVKYIYVYVYVEIDSMVNVEQLVSLFNIQ